MALLAVLGPLGTLLSLWVLPAAPPGVGAVSLLRQVARGGGRGGGGAAAAGRVIHLSLAGTGRKARYVLPEGAKWDDFTFGVQERLRLAGMSRIETLAGEAIMSVEDLVHDDTIVIYSDEALPTAASGGGGSLLFSGGGRPVKLLPDSLDPALANGGGAPSSLPADGGWRRRKREPEPESEGAADAKLMPRLFLKRRAARQRRDSLAAVTAAGPDGYGMAAEGVAEAAREVADRPKDAETGADDEGDDEAAHAREIEQARARQRAWQKRFEEADAAPPRHEVDVARTATEASRTDPQLPRSEAESLPADGEPCGERHPDFRIALLIPWVGPLPLWTSYFVSSARLSAPLADFLVFHEAQEELVPRDAPDNVQFFDLGVGGLSMLFGMQLGESLNLPIRNATVVIKALRFMFEKWPRLVAEYKPTFGSVFSKYLKGYTHWGYCDLDMVIGNLPLFIERSELEDNDIVTYSFGDQEAFYLRGQWTVHRNEPRVSTLWQARCYTRLPPIAPLRSSSTVHPRAPPLPPPPLYSPPPHPRAATTWPPSCKRSYCSRWRGYAGWSRAGSPTTPSASSLLRAATRTGWCRPGVSPLRCRPNSTSGSRRRVSPSRPFTRLTAPSGVVTRRHP